MNAQGEELAAATVASDAVLVRVANLAGDKEAELLTFKVVGSAVMRPLG